MGDIQFANPKLQRFVSATRPRTKSDYFKWLFLESKAWLSLLLNYYVVLPGIVWSLMILGIISCSPSYPDYNKPTEAQVYYVLIWAFILLPIATWLLQKTFRKNRRKAKRYRINNRRRLSWDRRDPILYLRSFYDDYVDYPDRADLKTPEELLTYALEDAGPVVCVGKPDERLPLLGAARIYFKDEDWQASVKYLMSISQLVVIHADVSAGLLWELQAAKELVKPEKLLISFLAWRGQDKKTRQKLYENFKARVNILFGGSLPEKIGGASFMLFNSDRTPTLIKLSKWKRLIFVGRTISTIRETLRPYLKRRGVKLGIQRYVTYFVFILLIIICLIITRVRLPLLIILGPIFFLITGIILRLVSYATSRIWLRFKLAPREHVS